MHLQCMVMMPHFRMPNGISPEGITKVSMSGFYGSLKQLKVIAVPGSILQHCYIWPNVQTRLVIQDHNLIKQAVVAACGN